MGLTISGIWERVWGMKDMRLLMVGLDAAGKVPFWLTVYSLHPSRTYLDVLSPHTQTTILYKFKLGEVVHTIPTIGFNVEQVEYKNIRLSMWDVGGQEKIRKLWRHYYDGAHGIIFVVDSCDRDRIDAAHDEVHRLMTEVLLSIGLWTLIDISILNVCTIYLIGHAEGCDPTRLRQQAGLAERHDRCRVDRQARVTCLPSKTVVCPELMCCLRRWYLWRNGLAFFNIPEGACKKVKDEQSSEKCKWCDHRKLYRGRLLKD